VKGRILTVNEAKELLQKCDLDQVCIVGWCEESGRYSVVTAGSSLEHAEEAHQFSQRLVDMTGIQPNEHVFEDLHEHCT
jgi:hypothetical protein